MFVTSRYVGGRRFANPRAPPAMPRWLMTSSQYLRQLPEEYDNSPAWAGDVPADDASLSLEALSGMTWAHAIQEGLPVNLRTDYGPMGAHGRRCALARVLREIDLLGPEDVMGTLSYHRSIYKHPYKQLVKGCGEKAGASRPTEGGGGGGGAALDEPCVRRNGAWDDMLIDMQLEEEEGWYSFDEREDAELGAGGCGCCDACHSGPDGPPCEREGGY